MGPTLSYSLFLLLTLLGLTYAQNPTNGSPCIVEADCNPTLTKLTCTTAGFCGCMPTADSYWDTTLSQCLLQVGKPCVQPPQPSDKDCPRNGACTGGTCACNNGFNLTATGTCFKNYGVTCLTPNDCDNLDTFQGCISNNNGGYECSCGLNAYWSSVPNQVTMCLLRVGELCGPCDSNVNPKDQGCAPGSSCSLVDTSSNIRQCACDDGLTGATDLLCYLPHGASCADPSRANLCYTDGFQECSGTPATCACTNPTLSVLEDNICHHSVNTTCELSGVGVIKECTSQSICDCDSLTCRCNTDAGFVSTTTAGMGNSCKCDTSLGLIPNRAGTACRKSWGITCNSADVIPCDTESRLQCLFGSCQCDIHQTAVRDNVTGLVHCYDDYETTFCTPATSIATETCNIHAGLSCQQVQVGAVTQNQCKCFMSEDQTYDNVTRRCLVKRNGRCHQQNLPRPGYSLVCESELACALVEGIDELLVGPYNGRCTDNNAGFNLKVGQSLWIALIASIFYAIG